MKRALMYASVASMIQQFNMNNISLLQELGYKVDVACNFEFGSTISQEKIESLKEALKEMNVDFYHIPVPRKITDIHNLKLSYSQTKELMNKNQYQLIHCHSPIGGIICRISNKNSNNYENTRMIYTAHGFHFFKGNNPLKNFLFRNIERYGAKYTDTLITINKEDYAAAKKFKLRKNGSVEYVPGVGIDLEKINSIHGNKEELCKELNIPSDSTLLLSVGELNDNKNHKVIIQSLPELPSNIHYVICGTGSLKKQHEELAKELHVEDKLHFLGYRSDIIKIMKSCDVFVFPSKREGLSVALMEAMACGLPCLVSNIRGNVDLIKNGKNGCYLNGNFKDNMIFCQNNYEKIKNHNINKIKQFSIFEIQSCMNKIYSQNKKVFHLLTTNEIGGAETLCISIINNMKEKYDCIYCSIDGNIRKKLEDNKIHFYPLKNFNLLEVKKAIKEIHPDIIHAHDIRATVYASLVVSNKLPVISHIHGNFKDMGTISFRSFLYKLIIPKISKIICVSKSVYNEFYWKKDLSKKGILLENKIDYKEITKRLDNIVDVPCYDFVFLGRLEEVKNPIRFIELINKVQINNKQITACMVGNGSLYEECLQYIEKKKVKIDMLGFQKEPLKFIKNCKALVMTSIAEGIPLAALETLACGKPIITTPTDGLCDIIQHGLNGFICENDHNFISCMNTILNDDEKYKEMCLYIKKNCSNEFEKYITQIEEVYSKVGGNE